LEVYLILWSWVSSQFSLPRIEAFTNWSYRRHIDPGTFGTYEGGNSAYRKLFGLSGAVGLTLASLDDCELSFGRHWCLWLRIV